jgi:hypothetical protein
MSGCRVSEDEVNHDLISNRIEIEIDPDAGRDSQFDLGAECAAIHEAYCAANDIYIEIERKEKKSNLEIAVKNLYKSYGVNV